VSQVEPWDDGFSSGVPDRLPARPDGRDLPAVDRHRERGLDLTPEEVAARRSNRRWMLALAVSSIIILALALVATGVFVSNEPSGPKVAVPPGYRAVNDGYFSYTVPSTWANNPANTDQAGDVDTSGPSGFAGEHIDYRRTAPPLGAAPPLALRAFGVSRPTPFDLTGARLITVPGTTAAFRYVATRTGGFRATVVNAYDNRAGVELWLMIQAPPDVTEQILSSLQA
jgi:hypothetical protein